MRHPIRQIRAAAPRYSSGAAWFFIVVSLLHLAWAGGVQMNGAEGATALYSATVGCIRMRDLSARMATTGVSAASATFALAASTSSELGAISRAREFRHIRAKSNPARAIISLDWASPRSVNVLRAGHLCRVWLAHHTARCPPE